MAQSQQPDCHKGCRTFFGCLWMPDFHLWAALQGTEEVPPATPVLVRSGGHVLAADGLASQRGVQPRWTLNRALSLLPEAHVLVHSQAQSEVAWNGVLERLYSLTPKVESARPGFAFCEVHLSPANTERAEAKLQAWKRLVADFDAGLGLASDRATAALAAFTVDRKRIRCIHRGCEKSFVGSVPLPTLVADGVSEETILRLGWFGVRVLRDLRTWTLQHLQSQFPDARTIWRYVVAGTREADRRPVTTWHPAPTISQRFVFEQATQAPDQWQSALEAALITLETELQGKSTSCITVTAEIRGQGSRTAARALRDAVSTRKRLREPAKSLLISLLGEGDELEALQIRLSVLRDEAVQELLFETKEKRTRALKEALRRLEARMPRAVLQLQPRDPSSALPEERFQLVPVDLAPEQPQVARRGRATTRKSTRVITRAASRPAPRSKSASSRKTRKTSLGQEALA